MAELQRLLDQRWDTGEIRTSLRASSLELLLRYLAEPVPEKWKQAVFTALIGLFEQRRMESGEPRMLSPELRSRFDAAVESSLPGQVREAVEEVARHEVADDSQSRVALAGRGVWHGTAPRFADLFLALTLSAVRDGEPDDMAAIVHLHDDEPSRDAPALSALVERRAAPLQPPAVSPGRMVDDAQRCRTQSLSGVREHRSAFVGFGASGRLGGGHGAGRAGASAGDGAVVRTRAAGSGGGFRADRPGGAGDRRSRARMARTFKLPCCFRSSREWATAFEVRGLASHPPWVLMISPRRRGGAQRLRRYAPLSTDGGPGAQL